MAVIRSESLVLRGVRVVIDVFGVMARKGLEAGYGKSPALLSLCHPCRTGPRAGNSTGVPQRSADADQRRDADGAGRSQGFVGGLCSGWRFAVMGQRAPA